MGEGVRYGGSVAGPEEVGAAADGQVASTHSTAHCGAHCGTHCGPLSCSSWGLRVYGSAAQVGTRGGTASRPLAVLSLLIAASRIARYCTASCLNQDPSSRLPTMPSGERTICDRGVASMWECNATSIYLANSNLLLRLLLN